MGLDRVSFREGNDAGVHDANLSAILLPVNIS
jgi:hypothetical protein